VAAMADHLGRLVLHLARWIRFRQPDANLVDVVTWLKGQPRSDICSLTPDALARLWKERATQ